MAGDRAKPEIAEQPENRGSLKERLLAGDRVTLGRAVNAVENDDHRAPEILRAIRDHLGRAQVVGITGAPGVGKSSLVSRLIGEFRGTGKTVGVIAVDPSSPLTGGAILGDRIRMGDHNADPGVFIRSVASRGHLGGLSLTASRVTDVMDAAGKDVIIIETVGTGQSEVEVMEIAQTVVVVCAPGLGDDIQAVKAGILEIADIFVVNKADNPLADRTERELKDAAVLKRHNDWTVPVLRTTATTGEGVADVAVQIGNHFSHVAPALGDGAALARTGRLVANAAAELVRERLADSESATLRDLAESVLAGETDIRTAAGRAAKLAAEED